MKNAYAVSLGIAEGFKKREGLSHNNTKSALFTFAVAEMCTLVNALGGNYKSVIGLPGMGDLEVTGEAGRNRLLGEIIGEGMNASTALEKMRADGITVEGYPAIKFGYNLAKQLAESDKVKLDKLPLLKGLYEILYEGKPSYEVIKPILSKCTGFYS
jgi:glycerol-3-phosphate dehydrogenase (NAD(P)+)